MSHPLLRRLSNQDDRGESLVELLVALGILATAVVALLGAMITGIRVSEMHRRQTEAGAYVKLFAETLEREVAKTPTRYTDCHANPQATYQSFNPVPPGDYEATVVPPVKYWDGDSFEAFGATCPATDPGVQLVTLRVRTTDPDRPAIVETLQITLRKPCRPDGVDPSCA